MPAEPHKNAPRRVTLAEVEAVLPTLNRRRRNPSQGFACAYTDPRNPSRHCIAGEVMTQLGVPVPGVDEPQNTANFRRLINADYFPAIGRTTFDADAIDLLERLQERADDGVTWGETLRDVLR